MSATIREQIITAYLTRLAAWTSTGFNHNCGESVHRASPHIDQSSLPACVLWPQPEEATQEYGHNVCTMTFKVEALAVVDEDENGSEIQEQLLGDVIKIMTDPAVTVTVLTDSIQYRNGGPSGAQNPEQTITGISAEFELKYQTLIGNPYLQE